MANQQDIVRVELRRLSALAEAYERAATDVADVVDQVTRQGRITEAWTQDRVSTGMWEHYNEVAVAGSFSSYRALMAFENELSQAARTLRQMHEDYRRTDEDAAWSLDRSAAL